MESGESNGAHLQMQQQQREQKSIKQRSIEQSLDMARASIQELQTQSEKLERALSKLTGKSRLDRDLITELPDTCARLKEMGQVATQLSEALRGQQKLLLAQPPSTECDALGVQVDEMINLSSNVGKSLALQHVQFVEIEEQAAEQENERRQKSFMGSIGRLCACLCAYCCCEEEVQAKAGGKNKKHVQGQDGDENGQIDADREGEEHSINEGVHSSTDEEKEEDEDEGCSLLGRV